METHEEADSYSGLICCGYFCTCFFDTDDQKDENPALYLTDAVRVI